MLVCRCNRCRHCLDRMARTVPGVEVVVFERQRPQHVLPQCDQVEIGHIRGLEDELPAGVCQGEQQAVGGTIGVEVV